MRTARFIAAARLEFYAAILYYDEAQAGLGKGFAAAVEEAAARALAFPRSGSPARGGTRRLIVRGFPFSVVYLDEPHGIVILAVAHHSRRPYYWRSRGVGDV